MFSGIESLQLAQVSPSAPPKQLNFSVSTLVYCPLRNQGWSSILAAVTGAEADGDARGSKGPVLPQPTDDAASDRLPGFTTCSGWRGAEDGEVPERDDKGVSFGEKSRESGSHCEHEDGATWEQRMEVGPWTSQK